MFLRTFPVRTAASVSCLLIIACGSSGEPGQSTNEDAAVDGGSRDSLDAGTPGEDAGDAIDSGLGDGTNDDAGPSLQDAGQRSDDAGQIEDDIPDGPNIVKMVAPSVCTVDDGRYLNRCHFGPLDLLAPTTPTEGRFRTRVSQHRKGDCTTGFRFVAELSAEGIEAYSYDLGLSDEVFLRRDDDAAIATLHVEERASLAGRAEYDISCRVWLEVEFNLPIEAP